MTRKLFLIGTVFCASLALAQPPRPGGPNGGTPPTAAEIAARRVDMLTNFLGLTDAQKAAATDIFTALATAEQPLFESQQAERKIIADSVKTNATGAIDAAASQLGQVEGQLAALRGKAEAKFYAVLTTDQKTKYDSRPMRGPGGFGGPGGPPPPPRGGH